MIFSLKVDAAYSIADLRRMAQRRLPRALFDFYDGGAEDETTLRANRDAFQRCRLRPRVLVDVAEVDASTRVVGAPSALPLAIAPTGAPGFGWPGADVAIAQAAAAMGIPYSLSSSARILRRKYHSQASCRSIFPASSSGGKSAVFVHLRGVFAGFEVHS